MRRSERRVVITGLGIVTPLGNDLSTTWNALRRNDRGIGPVTRFDARNGARQFAAEAKEFDPRSHFRIPKALKLTDRKTRFAVAAASMALADAALTENNADFERVGVSIGAGSSDLQLEEVGRAIGSDPELKAARDIPFFASRVVSGLNPLWLLVNLPNMVSAHVAIQIQACGPNNTVMTDWVAGAQAVGEAFGWIGNGEADAVLAGGADSGVFALAFATYAQGGILDGGDSDRGDFVIGEGAAMLVLEEREHALRRGARIYAEVHSYASASSPLTEPAGGSVAATMRRVLTEAGWRPDEVAAICAASVFSLKHRELEREALMQLFQRPVETLPLVEFKSSLGHTLSASGAIDLALLVKSLEESVKPARALCNSLGFCGQAVTLAVSA